MTAHSPDPFHPDFLPLAQTLRQLGPDELRRFADALDSHANELAGTPTDRGRSAVYQALAKVADSIKAHQVAQLEALGLDLDRNPQR